MATGVSSGLGCNASGLLSRGGLELGGVGNGRRGDISGRAAGAMGIGVGLKWGVERGATGGPEGE